MYKDVLRSIEGVEMYPIISLLVFFAFFTVLIGWFFLADRDRLSELAALPLDTNKGEERDDE